MVSRQEAKAQGLTHYNTGKPCLRGHLSERLVGSGACCQCLTERGQTPEVKAQQAAYYQANAERIAARDAAYYQANRAEVLARGAGYYQQNRAELAAKQSAYAKANRHLRNAHHAKRRAAKLQQTPPWADLEAIKAIYEQAAFLTMVTGESNHVDHIVPLLGRKVRGLHVAANLQILTATDNLNKSNTLLLPEEMPESAVKYSHQQPTD